MHRYRYLNELSLYFFTAISESIIRYFYNFLSMNQLYFVYKRWLIIHDSSTIVQWCFCYGTNRYGTLSLNPLIYSYFLHLQCFSQGCGSGSALTMVDWIRISIGNANPDPEEQKWPLRIEKSEEKNYVFKCSMFSFEGLLFIYGGLGISKIAIFYP